jgi:hypothetical protein
VTINFEETLLIGIDGGATEAKAHEVRVEGSADAPRFLLGEKSASRKYRMLPDFQPVNVQEQIKQRNENSLQLTEDEKKQGKEYIKATAEAVVEIANAVGKKKVLVGMGMPGLKTGDGRGINAINNGARTPDFLEQLENMLKEQGLELAAPIARLGSDADYCGIGEDQAAEGLFKDVENAYYFGGGTGIADAMKLKGSLVPFDHTKEWLQKAWQIPCSLGPTYEKLIAAKAMNETFARLEKSTLEEYVAAGKFAQVEAATGNTRGLFVMQMVSMMLAELIYERMYTLFAGREETPWRGEGYMNLKTEHPYKGMTFKRVILGQRIGDIFGDEAYSNYLRKPLSEQLASIIRTFAPDEMKEAYLEGDFLRKDLIVSSHLRAAPAIGAAIDAVAAVK